MTDVFQKNDLIEPMQMACDWLSDIAQIKHKKIADEGDNVASLFKYDDYRGALKGEYLPAYKMWSDFCPIWHTGQAVVALLEAYKILKDEKLITSAKAGVDFIMRNRNTDKSSDDYGLIYAYEGSQGFLNTSAIIESLSALIDFSQYSGDNSYLQAAEDVCNWIVKKMWREDKSLFIDLYKNGEVVPSAYRGDELGRPLADDAIFLKVGRICKNDRLVEIFYKVLARLIKDENPAGNWVKYEPNDVRTGKIHPRHAYWWGLPFLDAYLDSKDERYLQTAERAAMWYVKAQRTDGGIIRPTYLDFNTNSFGHATSGSACAVKFWCRMWAQTQNQHWLEPIKKGIDFCLKMQMKTPKDSNLKGGIIEKIIMPNQSFPFPSVSSFGVKPKNSDDSLIYIRDLGTIFFVQAICEVFKQGLVS
ncbi:MAG: hypothetical protein A2Y12_18025 [Planctomycetes bacterium GWF2_42_9]|nr:MAG: hypothetical protein A2Y12_18025 [Planctomycetes bacterium GWF2_42_9]